MKYFAHRVFRWRWTLLLLSAAAAHGQDNPDTYNPNCWRVAGSTLVIDTEDLGSAQVTGPQFYIRGNASWPVTIGARQSITGVTEDLDGYPMQQMLYVRYRDNGPEARVVVYLKKVSLATGTATDLLVFDSDRSVYGQDGEYHNGSWGDGRVFCGSVGGGFHLKDNLYFVRAEITKSGPGGDPGIASVAVCSKVCYF